MKKACAEISSGLSEFPELKDTGVNICADDVSGHVKVELDEFSLRTVETGAAAMTAGKTCTAVTEDFKTDLQSVTSCRS